MTIRSNPSNALAILDGQEIGHTPVSIAFTYYGERQIKLIKDGFETKTINQTISPPWYERIGLDFFSEVVVPWQIRDERDYDYSLEPRMMVPGDELLKRAEDVRREGQNPSDRVRRRAGLPVGPNP